MLQAFSDGFKAANRSVFIDTYSNYYFVKNFAAPAEAKEFIDGDVLTALKHIHSAAQSGKYLDSTTRKDIFKRVLRWEQTTTVGPAVNQEVAKFDCPILRSLVLRPIVRFAYFPRWKYFFFKNFSDTEERIHNAHQCFDLAEGAGWDSVFSSMKSYPVLPIEFYKNPKDYSAELRKALLADGGV